MVMYAVATNSSVGALFMAGVVPGFMLAAFFRVLPLGIVLGNSITHVNLKRVLPNVLKPCVNLFGGYC